MSDINAITLSDVSKMAIEARGKLKKAFWGYVRWDIASESNPAMKFGVVNNRPILDSVVTRLIAAMRRDGIRRCAVDTVVPVMIPRDMLNEKAGSQEFTVDLETFPLLTSVYKTVPKEVKVLGGQHRRKAMVDLTKQATDNLKKGTGEKELQDLYLRRQHAQKLLEESTEGSESHRAALTQLVEVDVEQNEKIKEIASMKGLEKYRGMWLVAVYIEGTSYTNVAKS